MGKKSTLSRLIIGFIILFIRVTGSPAKNPSVETKCPVTNESCRTKEVDNKNPISTGSKEYLSPGTDLGSFEIIPTETKKDVYFYWQPIPEDLNRGKFSSYKIVGENEKKLVPSEITDNYAKLEGVEGYKFKILFMNEVGGNPNGTEIILPGGVQLVERPRDLMKIYFGNGSYEVSWEPPEKKDDVVDYTIFWCETRLNRSCQCLGSLNWTHVPNNETTSNITVPNPNSTCLFAISANTNKTSSGMQWEYCTSIKNTSESKISPKRLPNNLDQIRNVEISRVTNTTMNISWKVPETLTPTRYKISYNNRTIIVGPENHSLELKNLLPYHNYSIQVVACTVFCSKPSTPIHRVTDIGVPGKIHKLRVRFLDSHQVIVDWNAPENPAGNLDYYEIVLNHGKIVKSDSTSVRLSIPVCLTVGEDRVYEYRVRAVNILSDNIHLKGVWSDPREGYCYTSNSTCNLSNGISIVVGLCISMTILCIVYIIVTTILNQRSKRTNGGSPDHLYSKVTSVE